MQPLPFFAVKQTIQQEIFANPQAPAAHFCFQSAVQLLQTRLSQSRETKNRATNLLREDHCTPESFRMCFRMKCVGKTCCAT
jgi:hypothetical protein